MADEDHPNVSYGTWMSRDAVRGALSVAATALSNLWGELYQCDHGDSNLQDPQLVIEIRRCIKTMQGISRALEETRFSRPPPAEDWMTLDDVMRLKHVTQDLDECAERLTRLERAAEYFKGLRE